MATLDTPNQLRDISRLFKVLGDPTRLKIMQLLLEEENVCVGEIADRLRISAPATSQHLRLLEMHGLLLPTRTGQRICYQPNHDNQQTDILIKTIQNLGGDTK